MKYTGICKVNMLFFYQRIQEGILLNVSRKKYPDSCKEASILGFSARDPRVSYLHEGASKTCTCLGVEIGNLILPMYATEKSVL